MEAAMTFEPQNLGEAEKLAGTLSKSALIPEHLRGKPGDILVTLLTGRELGLKTMQALRSIAVVKGKPSLSADLMVALVKQRRDVCEYLVLVESTEKRAAYRAKRVGEPEPTEMDFTMEDARAAGLTSSGMYAKFPKAMLRARAASAICRAVFPDLCLGLYDSDSGELTDGQPVTPEVVAKPEEKPTPKRPRATEDAQTDGPPALPAATNLPPAESIPATAKAKAAEMCTHTRDMSKACPRCPPGTLYAGPAAPLTPPEFGKVEAPRDVAARVAAAVGGEVVSNEALPDTVGFGRSAAAKIAELSESGLQETISFLYGHKKNANPEYAARVERHIEACKAEVRKRKAALGPPITFGPLKGSPIRLLSEADLSSAIELAHTKLMEQPDAKWAKPMRDCLALLEADVVRRMQEANAAAQNEPGASEAEVQ